MRTIRMFMVLAAVLAVGSGLSVLAQDQPSVARGELVKVDTAARTIVIKTDAGPQMQFSYTAETKVTGAEKGVAGLATMTGTPVSIEFTKKDQTNLARSIDVQKKP